MACNRKAAMSRRVLLLGGLGLGLVLTSHAQVQVALPVGGAGPGQSILLPVRIQPSPNLAGVQCDILFDATRLACDGAQFAAGTPGVVVDGANALPDKPGMFRLLAYTSLGTPLTNGVTCGLAFGENIVVLKDTTFRNSVDLNYQEITMSVLHIIYFLLLI